MADAPRVFRAWRDFMATVPDEVASLFLMWNVPDSDPFPPEVRRQPVVIPATVHCGPVEDGERVLQPIREWATPLIDLSGPTRYAELQAAFDPFFPVGRFYYWKSTYIDDLSDMAIDTLIERAMLRPSPMSAVTFWQLGGAISRVGDAETAFGRRSAPYLFTAEATWDDPARNEQNISWSRESLARMKPFSKGGLYLNFPGFSEEKEAQLRDAYGANYDRLVEIKTRYDPGNLFRMNLNIAPST
jgi:FAD/FMN-containing dehydrogenase